jgi:hypothetical protein
MDVLSCMCKLKRLRTEPILQHDPGVFQMDMGIYARQALGRQYTCGASPFRFSIQMHRTLSRVQCHE